MSQRHYLRTLIIWVACSIVACAAVDEKQIVVMLNSGYKSEDIETLIRQSGYGGRRDADTLTMLKQNGASLELIDLISYDLKFQYPLVAADIRAMLLNKTPIGEIINDIDDRSYQGRLSSSDALDLVTYGATPDLIRKIQKTVDDNLHTPDETFLLIGLKPRLMDKNVVFDKAGYATASRRMLIRPEWEEANFFNSGLARVRSGNNYGYIDKTGALAIAPIFSLARDFSEGRAVVSTAASDEFTYRYITTNGILLENEPWDDAADFKEGFARVALHGKYGYLNADGKLVIPTQWTSAGDFSQGLAWVNTASDSQPPLYGFINNKGILVIPAVWDEVKSFSEGLAAVKKNGLWGFINLKGKQVIENKYPDARSFSESVSAVKVDYLSLEKWVYINYDGQLAVTGTWLEAGDYHKGLAQVTDSSGDLVINKNGTRQLPPEWHLSPNQPQANVVLVTRDLPDNEIEAAYMELSGRIIWRSE